MTTMDYDSFVFYGNWRTILDGFDKETAKDILWQIMLYGTAGEVDTSNPMINGIVMGCCAVGIDKAKDRYANAVDNGKKGGRPSEIDAEHIQELKESGLTNKEIAAELGCSTRTIERANRQNRQNLNININNNKNINNNSNTDTTINMSTEINTDIATAIIDLFKNKNKYKDIQAKIKADFDTDISFDDIKSVIDNKSTYIALAEKEKETRAKNYFKQVEYDCIPDVIEKLNAHGITTSYDEVKTAYDEVQDSNLCSKWNVRDLVSNCYLNPAFIGDTKGLKEYASKIIRSMDETKCYFL